MNLMLVKSFMEPSFDSYSSSGMRNRYQVHSSVLPFLSFTLAVRLSAMWLRPTTMSSGLMLTLYW